MTRHAQARWTTRSGRMADFKFVSHKDEIEKELEHRIYQTLEAWGETAERYAKSETPVDTGRLRNSITYQTDVQGGEMAVGTDVEYAEWVETNDDARHPTGRAHFIRDSIAIHLDEYEILANRFLKG